MGHGHIVKMQFFLPSFSIHWGIDQSNIVYCNDDQGRVYQNHKCHDIFGAGALTLERCHISINSEYALSSTLPIYGTLIFIV